MKNFFNAAFKNPVSISIISLFLTLLIWWIWSYFFESNISSFALNLWSDVYFLVALYGGIFGVIVSGRWGGTRTFIGKAIIAFSIGLLFQCFGQLSYAYYMDFLNTQIPYPSIGDIGYFGSVLFYIYGALMLVRMPKEKATLEFIGSRVYAIIIPLAMLILSYFILLKGYLFDWSNPMKIFLDFGYSLFEAAGIFIILLAFSFSRQKLGEAMKKPILFFIFALVFQYLSDFVFIYQANNATWHAGSINEVMYLISYILMAMSLILLSIWPKILSD